jgi:phosphoribosylformylglycinamidine synthase
MAATSGLGCDVSITVDDERDIFAESMSRAIIEVSPENAAEFEASLNGIACEKIGTVGGDKLKINDVEMSLADLKEVYFGQFKKVIEQDI